MLVTDKTRRMEKENEALFIKTPIKEDRRPFLRMIDEPLAGLVIGDQRDTTRCNVDKKNAQCVYFEQLAKDIENNSTKNNRGSPIRRRIQNNVQDEGYTNGLVIGKDMNLEKEEKRAARENLLSQTLLDLGNKLEKKSLRELHLERVQNKASGFNIGADESMARAMKKAEQMKYSTLLSADNQGSPRDFTRTEQYEDVSPNLKKATQTGLLIGGYCSDASASVQSLHSVEKKAIQRNYRNALRDQQQVNNNIEHERELIEIQKGFDTSSVPYMRSK